MEEATVLLEPLPAPIRDLGPLAAPASPITLELALFALPSTTAPTVSTNVPPPGQLALTLDPGLTPAPATVATQATEPPVLPLITARMEIPIVTR